MDLLVCDIGTSSIRAAIVRDDATVLHEQHREFLPDSPAPGLVEFDAAAMAAGSNSTIPGAGESGRKTRCCSWRTVASSRTIAARIDDVPMSQTRRSIAVCPDAQSMSSGHTASAEAQGSGRPSFPGLRMPFGSSARLVATSTSNAGPSASWTKRDRLSPTPW